MADPVKSTARWKAKYNLKRVNETLNDLREGMAMRYETAMAELSVMEGKVKEVINAYGVSTSQYVPYLPRLTVAKPLLRSAALQTEPAAAHLG